MSKETILGALKSKTINLNFWLTLAIIWYSNTHNIEMDEATATQIVAALYAVSNGLVRFFTTKSLPEKGISVPNPKVVQNMAKNISENEDAVKELYEALAKYNKQKKIKKGLEA